jgi:hypothetical protein
MDVRLWNLLVQDSKNDIYASVEEAGGGRVKRAKTESLNWRGVALKLGAGATATAVRSGTGLLTIWATTWAVAHSEQSAWERSPLEWVCTA